MASKFVNMIPGVSMIAGAFAGKTKEASMSEQTKSLGGAFGGSVADISAAQSLSGKRMFGSGKTNRFIEEQNEKNRRLTDMKDLNDRRLSSASASDLANQNLNRYAGNTMTNLRVGKEGMKLPTLEEVRTILKSFKEDEVQKFQLGGKMNVIVEGALHARKNHLHEVSEDLEDVTHKGIPVVALEEGGELVQNAEVEDRELVITKELTDKLEGLYKDGSEEAMIEAGKLLAEELMTNTDDRTEKLLDNEEID